MRIPLAGVTLAVVSFAVIVPEVGAQSPDLSAATAAFETLTRDLKALVEGDLARLKADLEAAGAPWTPGR